MQQLSEIRYKKDDLIQPSFDGEPSCTLPDKNEGKSICLIVVAIN